MGTKRKWTEIWSLVFTTLFITSNVKAGMEPIKWRINLPEGLESSIQTTTPLSSNSFQFTRPTNSDPQSQSSKIRLVDWREWSQMRPAYSATIGAPPLLIVDTDSALDGENQSHQEKETKLTIPEMEEQEMTTMSSLNTTISVETTTSGTTTSSSSTTTTTTTTPLETTTTPSEEPESTTTPKETPDVKLELKNLPDMLTLLKSLSLIPAVVRSFSSAAASSGGQAFEAGSSGPSTSALGSIISSATSQQGSFNELKSRALSANSGYNARSPQFIAAPSTDSEIPQTFFGRRSQQQSLPNMPAPIVPVNKRQEAMKPREIGNLNYFPPTSQRLNIYGIDPKTSMAGSRDNVGNQDPASYNAPMTQPPPSGTDSKEQKRQRPRFDLSNLTVNEVEQLESIHRKLFQHPANGSQSVVASSAGTKLVENDGSIGGGGSTQQPSQHQPSPLPLTEQQQSLFIFQKPSQTNKAESAHNPTASELMLTSSSIQSSLKPEMIDELMMVKDIPDLEELTKGMDLSLLSKPGGFALLKQQFIERLIQRSLVQKRRRWMARRKMQRRNRRRY